MGGSDRLKVVGAAYTDVADAMTDFAEMQYLYGEGEIGEYDAAIVTKETDGTLVLSNGDASGRFKGAAAGAVAGAVLGIIFPPSMLGLAALGAGAGALAGHVKSHISRSDIKELGELLNPGESGILLVSERIEDSALEKLMPRAARKKGMVVEGDAEAIKAAVRAAAEDS